MLELSVELPSENIDTEKITKRIQAGIERLFKDAVLEYIKTVDQIVPVLTGQAKGVFNAIINALGLVYSMDMTPNSPYTYEIVLKGGITRREYLIAHGQSPEAGEEATTVTFGFQGDNFVFLVNWDAFEGYKDFNYYAVHEDKWQTIATGVSIIFDYMQKADLDNYIPNLFSNEFIIYILGQEIDLYA